jgi:hypothetical protein
MAQSNGNGNGNGGRVIPLSRARAAIARPRGARHVDALISAPNPEAAVAALSIPELYFLVKDVGFADTTELIALATPEQIRGCLDLDLWDRDRLEDSAAHPWLVSLMEAGYEKLGSVWEALDSELAALILQRWTRIYDLSLEQEAPENSDFPLVTTPDSFFAIEIIAPDEDDARLTMRLIEDLYRADMVLARHTIMSARSEPPAELEEGSYRWRSGRMADIGYVEFYEALEVFRPLDPASIEIGEDAALDDVGGVAEGDESRVPRNLPATMADAIAGDSFLARALAQVADGGEVDRLEASLVLLINKVLSASRVSPGDAEAVRTGAEHAAATVSLGLETVAAGSLDAAVRALASVSVTRLHRAGFSVTLRLARLAQALAPRAVTSGDEDRALIAALCGARPWFPLELDDPPDTGVRAFGSVADVRAVGQRLAVLALRIAIAEQGMGADLLQIATQPEPRPALDDHARTALARALAGGDATGEPLGPDEIPGDFSPPARERAAAALVARLDATGVTAGREYLTGLIGSWLERIHEQLGNLSEPPDPRFVSAVLLRSKLD